MDEHKVVPARQGGALYCKACGYAAQYVRHRVRRPFFRHTSGSALSNLRRANLKRSAEAGTL